MRTYTDIFIDESTPITLKTEKASRKCFVLLLGAVGDGGEAKVFMPAETLIRLQQVLENSTTPATPTPQIIIRAAVAKAQQDGIFIRAGSWGLNIPPPGEQYTIAGSAVCPLGAVMLGRVKGENVEADAAKVLGVSEAWVRNFTQVFDNPQTPYSPGGEVACALREELGL